MSYNLPDGCTDADIERAWGEPEEDEEEDEIAWEDVHSYTDLARYHHISLETALRRYPPEALKAAGILS